MAIVREVWCVRRIVKYEEWSTIVASGTYGCNLNIYSLRSVVKAIFVVSTWCCNFCPILLRYTLMLKQHWWSCESSVRFSIGYMKLPEVSRNAVADSFEINASYIYIWVFDDEQGFRMHFNGSSHCFVETRWKVLPQAKLYFHATLYLLFCF